MSEFVRGDRVVFVDGRGLRSGPLTVCSVVPASEGREELVGMRLRRGGENYVPASMVDFALFYQSRIS